MYTYHSALRYLVKKPVLGGRFYPGGSPHGKFIVLCTPWDKSLKSLIIGGKE
jgi:hypothetical protein